MGKRYIKDIQLDLPEDEVQSIMQRFLSTNRFEMKTSSDGNPYYVLGENSVRSYCFFQYHYKDGCLHMEAWLGLGKVEEGLTGWGSVVEKSTYLERVHRLIEELLALLPAGHPVVVAISKELAHEKRSNQAGIVFMVVMLCLFGLMYAVAKYS